MTTNWCVYRIIFKISCALLIMFLCSSCENNPTLEYSKPIGDSLESIVFRCDNDDIDMDTHRYLTECDLISELHKSLIKSINDPNRKVDTVAEHWLKSGESFMIHRFLGEVVISRGYREIKKTWRINLSIKDNWLFNNWLTDDKIFIKGNNEVAKAEGGFNYKNQSNETFKAIYQRDEGSKWKIKAIDFGDHGFIEGFKVIF